MINRAPANDENIARRTDGSEADFTSQVFLQAQAAVNRLNETQLVLVNNDVLATINSVFDTSQLMCLMRVRQQRLDLSSWPTSEFKYSLFRYAMYIT